MSDQKHELQASQFLDGQVDLGRLGDLAEEQGAAVSYSGRRVGGCECKTVYSCTKKHWTFPDGSEIVYEIDKLGKGGGFSLSAIDAKTAAKYRKVSADELQRENDQ